MRIARLVSVFLVALTVMPAAPKEFFMFVGTYTNKSSKGIYAFRFDAASGQVKPIGLAAELTSPSFVAIHQNGRLLYAVSETNSFQGQKTGSVTAFALDPKTGQLTLLNAVSSHGSGPCFVSVDKTGKCLLAANYGSGSVAAMPLKADGSMMEAASFIQHEGSGPNAKRQQGPHAHSINVSPDNRFAFAPDLGLDKVMIYRLDAAKGLLTANDPPFAKVAPGAGPRHFAFHPSGKYAYVINEIQSTITAFSYDAAKGALTELETVKTLPKDFSGNSSTAEVQVHPSGKFVYGSNRGHDSIAVFAVDPRKGTLTPVEHVATQGRTPRNFGIDPSGAFLAAANQDSDSIVIFRIDAQTGKLTPTGTTLQVGSPVCVKFTPAAVGAK